MVSTQYAIRPKEEKKRIYVGRDRPAHPASESALEGGSELLQLPVVCAVLGDEEETRRHGSIASGVHEDRPFT